VVTRDASGLAEAVVEAFAAEGAAALLAGSDALPLDPTDEASCRDALAAVEARHGRLDALCNLASARPPLRPLHELDEAAWEAAVAATIRSTLLVSRFALPLLRRSGGGSIVNLSHAAALVGIPGTSLLAATSGALLNMTRATAATSRADGVRVNCVCLGSTAVPALPSHLVPGDAPPPVRELAPLFVFLASDESRHVNGQVLCQDDGLTAWRDGR
jgi:NAD(P)-dependent dehydrogenase (short-subunit alcohol dehydrogenase family)